jgi:hypothetical protein
MRRRLDLALVPIVDESYPSHGRCAGGTANVQGSAGAERGEAAAGRRDARGGVRHVLGVHAWLWCVGAHDAECVHHLSLHPRPGVHQAVRALQPAGDLREGVRGCMYVFVGVRVCVSVTLNGRWNAR